MFHRLAQEELHGANELPSFGYSTWAWATSNKDKVDTASAFYSVWINFATSKEFEWTEPWNLSDAPDRRVRRLLEKENKKARDEARREFNDTIRALARFIRKRDPRYKTHIGQQKQSGTSTPMASQSATAAAQRRTEAAEAYVEQDWQKIEHQNRDADLEWAVAEGNDEEEWECVACSKSFRSEAAWDSHERSKKHLKEVQRLKREMEREEAELGLADEMDPSPPPLLEEEGKEEEEPARRKKKKKAPASESLSIIERKIEALEIPQPPSPGLEDPNKKDKMKEPLSKTEKRAAMSALREESTLNSRAASPGADDTPQMTKRDKRRAKQAKKDAEGSQTQLICNVCNEAFGSKTKLFKHIQDEGHALAEPGTRGKHKKGK